MVEPCAGSFVMPTVARAAGWLPGQLEASDVGLYSSICGFCVAGRDLDELQVAVDGSRVVPSGSTLVERGAHLLWVQLVTRMESRPKAAYWQAVVRDLHERRDEHIAEIVARLRRQVDVLGGLHYEALDMWAHMERVVDDPRTVVNINAPTYAGGFERFFDTKGRLTWNEPAYTVWDPAKDQPKLLQMFEGKSALLLTLQQCAPRQAAHPNPIFARHLSPGQCVYYLSNRPEEIFAITGGPQVKPRLPTPIRPLNIPTISRDQQITQKSEITVEQLPDSAASYYKDVWLHRIQPKKAAYNFVVLVDGKVAGIAGYALDAMLRSYPSADGTLHDKWRDCLILTYAVGAPHNEYRLTRLVTTLALQRQVANRIVNPMFVVAAERVVTSEYTQYPESKGMRGLMKLAEKKKDPKAGYKLVYVAELGLLNVQQALKEWLQKEERWRKVSRKAA